MPSFATPGRLAALVALAVFAMVAIAGSVRDQPQLAVPAAKAERLAAAAPAIRDVVRHATRWHAVHIDDDLVKVTWYRGSRIVATAGVRHDGTLFQPVAYREDQIGYGARLSHGRVLLAAMTMLFLLATLRRPLRRRQSLPALLIAGFVVPVVLIDGSHVAGGEVLAAALLLAVLAAGVAAAWRGAPGAGEDGPVLLEELAERAALPRLARQVGVALLAVTLLVTLTSTAFVDVAAADMEGATLLLHGVLPYGHMPGDVIHGDTYGLPIYALYAPFAALWPMHSTWDDPEGALVAGAIAIVLTALALARVAGGNRWIGLVAALSLPAALMGFSSGTNDMLIAAAVMWALAWFARPAASSALLMLAGLAKVAPMVLLPLWLARLRGRALCAALLACAGVAAIVVVALGALGGLNGPADMVSAMAFQLDRRSEMSVWTALDAAALQPVAQGLVLAVALGGAVLIALDRGVAADPRRVAGLVTAVLAGLQLAASHWMPLYLLWLLPPAMVALLGPLGAREAAPARAQAQRSGVRPTGAVCPSSATLSRARSPVPSSPPAA